MDENPQVIKYNDGGGHKAGGERCRRRSLPALKKITAAYSAGIDLKGNSLGSILQQARICLRDEIEGAARSARQRRFASAVSPARRKLEI